MTKKILFGLMVLSISAAAFPLAMKKIKQKYPPSETEADLRKQVAALTKSQFAMIDVLEEQDKKIQILYKNQSAFITAQNELARRVNDNIAEVEVEKYSPKIAGIEQLQQQQLQLEQQQLELERNAQMLGIAQNFGKTLSSGFSNSNLVPSLSFTNCNPSAGGINCTTIGR